jgi:hypothetical protein
MAFALLYGTRESHIEACNLALRHRNLSVLARNGGVIGGETVRWQEESEGVDGEEPSIGISWDKDQNEAKEVSFTLGDFVELGKLFQELVGTASKPSEEVRGE